MAKKVTVLLFVVALMIFTFSPGNELRFDAIGQALPGSMGQAAAQDAFGQDGLFTPAPTPTVAAPTPTATPKPTLQPTPTPQPTPEPTPIVKGMKNGDVSKLQSRLIALGFLEGAVDGAYGTGTVNAVNNVKQFLNDQFLKTAASQPAVQAYFDGDEDPNATQQPTPQVQLPYALDGQADWKLLEAIYSDSFSDNFDVLTEGDKGSAVKRVQSRLTTLGYLYKGADGAFGPGTTEGIAYFQKVNGLSPSGVADRNTQAVLFSERALKSDKPLHEYKVVVDVSDQRVSVYQWNQDKEDYTKLVQKFKCSTGRRETPTPKGTYDETVRRGADWHYFKNFGCWAQYAIHIDPTGDVMFHSVIYNKKGGRPTSGSVSALGRRASHGCIRLSVANAKWLWENITDGTTVVIQ